MKKSFGAVAWMQQRRAAIDREDEGWTGGEEPQDPRRSQGRSALGRLKSRVVEPAAADARQRP